MPLQVRRGPTADRLLITPVEGELILDTTENTLFIGDGVTPGGVAASDFSFEDAQDAAAALFTSGIHPNVTFTYNDQANRIDTVLNLRNYNGVIEADAFQGSLFSDNSTLLVDGILGSINLDGTIRSDLIPVASEVYDIGSPTNKFKDLYLSGSSLWIGDAQVTAVGSAINLPAGSAVDGIPIGSGNGGIGDGIVEGSNYRINIIGDDSTVIVDSSNDSINALDGFFSNLRAAPDGASSSKITFRNDVNLIGNSEYPLQIFNANDSDPPEFQTPGIRMFKARGGDFNNPSPILKGEFIGDLTFSAYSGIEYTTAARIGVTVVNPDPNVVEPVDPADTPAAMTFFIQNNNNDLKRLLILDPDDRVIIGDPESDNADGALNLFTGYSSQRAKGILFSQHHNEPDATRFNFVRTRGTILNQQAVQDGDRLASMLFLGHDGTDTTGLTSQRVGGVYYIEVDGAVTPNNVPSKFVWRLNDGSAPPGGSSSAPIQAELLKTSTLKINNLSSLTDDTSINFLTMAKLVSYTDETAANAAVNSAPSAGMIYFDTGASKAKVYDGSVWRDLW